MYDDLLGFGYLYKDLYEMDIVELSNTLKQQKQRLGYKMWKEVTLIGALLSKEEFPKTPEDASPELYPPKKTYKMYDFLKNGTRKGMIKNGR